MTVAMARCSSNRRPSPGVLCITAELVRRFIRLRDAFTEFNVQTARLLPYNVRQLVLLMLVGLARFGQSPGEAATARARAAAAAPVSRRKRSRAVAP